MAEIRSTKHMEMLQAAITRMAGTSFAAKGWSVTLATATLGLAAKEDGCDFLWIGALAVLLFWLIDAYYLALETGFRALFTAAAARFTTGTELETFEMTPAIGFGSTLRAALRPAVLMIHLSLLGAFALAGLLLC